MEMNIDESKLVPNSGISKANDISKEEKKVAPVVSGNVTKRKKPFGKKMIEAFVGDDIEDVKPYLLYDILIPAIKDTLSDLIGTAVNMVLFGEARRPQRISRNGNRSSYISYDQQYRGGRSYSEKRTATYNRRAVHEFDDILFENRFDAEEVLSHLHDLIEIYGCATVADLYDLVDQSSSYTDRGFGWTRLGGASVQRIRDGYILDLPRVEPL